MLKQRKITFWKILFSLSFINLFIIYHSVFAYNKSWDQGHECVLGLPGATGWGRYGYDTSSPADFKGGFYSSKECCELLCKACPVYANTGRFQKTFSDLTVPGVGPSLNITRTYISQEFSNSLLGHGWIFNFGKKMIISRNKLGEKVLVVRLKTGELNFFKEQGSIQQLTEYGLGYNLSAEGGGYVIKNKDGSTDKLDADGKLVSITDKNGNKMLFTYDAVGCLSRITNASGNYVDFQLGPNGKIVSISDNLGRTINYSYDQNGNLTSSTDPLGNATQYVYDSKNRLIKIVDPLGNNVFSLTYTNDQPAKVATFTEKGETYTITYYTDHTEKKDSHGNTWTYYFNSLGIIEKGIDPSGNITTRQHNKVTSTSLDWEEDPNGNKTTYSYDADGNIVSKADPLGNTWTYAYVTGTNWLATETNPVGVVSKYEYDSNGNLTKIIRDYEGSLQNTTTYVYDAKGNKTGVIDPLGYKTSYEFDAKGNLIKITDPLSNTNTFTYDARGNKLTETDANSNTTKYSYDLMNRLISVTDALGNITSYGYDTNGNKISETDANGNIRSFTYDAYNRIIEEKDPLGNKTASTYDSKDNRISMTDANGNTTAYIYDTQNRLISMTDALGGQTNYTYDKKGNLLTITDANGNTESYMYDADSRRTSATNAAGEKTEFGYDAAGNQITLTFPNGNLVTRSYDSLNRVTMLSDALGIITNYNYNLLGQIVSETDALGNSVKLTYDINGKLREEIDSLGNKLSYVYDPVGNTTSITDRNRNTVNFSYDLLNRKISVRDQLMQTTLFAYGKTGSLVSVTDANGNQTSYSYDSLNRLIKETYADATSKTYSYDPIGNMIKRTDQKGQVTAYIYDKLNHCIKVDYPGTNDYEYLYDAVGNILSANNENAVLSFNYDKAYRFVQSVQNGKPVANSYDIVNNTRTITYPGGKIIKEIMNQRGLLTQVQDSSNQPIVQYTYDAADRIKMKIYGNGITANFSTNSNGYITTIDYQKSMNSILTFQYGFDKEGNRIYVQNINNPSNSEQYVYDNKYRLINFKRGVLDGNGNISSPIVKTSYNLDVLGNWISKTTDGTTETRTYNSMNEITSLNGMVHSYDAIGNLIDDGVNIYEYDSDNRLLKLTRKYDNKILGEYKYDALGRRISKQISGVITDYFFDNSRVIEEQIGNVTDCTYNYGSGIDEIISMERDGQQYYYLTNSLGSVMASTNSSGNIVERYSYDAYGKPSILKEDGTSLPDSIIKNHYLFTGREFDEESDLQFNRSRYLSYDLGRWITRDPIGYQGSSNLYEYVYNNPITLIDPFGLKGYMEGTTDPTIVHDPGAGTWNSEPWTLSNVLLKEFISNNIGLVWFAMPDAVDHLMHYFQNTGQDYTIRLQNMIDEVPSAKNVFNSELALAQAFVESLPDGNHEITSGEASGGYNRKSESWNWYYAVGGYSAWGKGHATVCEDEYTLQFEYKFDDRYNWDNGKAVNILGVVITDQFMGEFHRQGLAQEFEMLGSVKKTVKWKRGQVPQIIDGWGGGGR